MSSNKLNIKVGGFSKTATLTIKDHIVDIVMLVAGTQDPVNTDPSKHAANTKYWQSSTANLWSELKKLKPQFIDLNLSEKFYSWTGDNNEEERNIAAERLLDLITRLYLKSKEEKTLKFEGKEVHLHLIGHSHGGNVINQFTELITNKEMLSKSEYPIEELPERWVIKSITYLSTPFFNDKHQLNHKKIHKDCKIINVYNEYDITQRFVADFTMSNLEYIIQAFNKHEAVKAIDKIKLIIDANTYGQLTEVFSWINKDVEGPLIWERTVLLLENVLVILEEVVNCVSSFKTSLESQKKTLTLLINDLIIAVTGIKDVFEKNKKNRSGNYGLAEFINDCQPSTLLKQALELLNQLLSIKGGVQGSYLLNLLAEIFAEDTGLTDSIDDTSWDPKKQVPNKEKIRYVDITTKDPYDKRGKKPNFDGFATGVEESLKKGNLQEMLMRLISQFIEPFDIGIAQGVVLLIASNLPIYMLKTKKQLVKLNVNLNRYRNLVDMFNADLVAEQDLTAEEKAKKAKKAKKEKKEDVDSDLAFTDEAIREFNIAYDLITKRKEKIPQPNALDKNKPEPHPLTPGTIPYLATVSHGLSHTQFWPEVEEELRNSFSSGINKGYKKTKESKSKG